MNDYERRALDIAQSSTYLAQYARTDKDILAIDYFGYNTILPGLTLNSSATSVVQIQSDSDFVMVYLSGTTIFSNNVIGGAIAATLQITDTGTGKTFFNAPAMFPLVVGSGGYPFLLPAPRVLAPNTNIKFDVTNLTNLGAFTADFYISMLGARIYYSA